MAFQQGLSGLNATAKNLEVIGNNIANANTFGAKASRAEFADVYANALNGAGTNPIGIGVSLAAVAQQFTQGNISTTDNPMDLAINGNGFFQVSDGVSPRYTRNGQFKLDRDGFIVNNQNLQLIGYPADGTASSSRARRRRSSCPRPASARRRPRSIDLEFNLDSRVGATLPAAGPPIDVERPEHLQQRDVGDGVRRAGRTSR